GVIQDMLRGDIQAGFLNVASTAGMVQTGQLRPLAVVNRTRLPEYPGIPTMQELGLPDVGTIAWQGLFAPAATPKPVLETLFQIVARAIQSPDTIEKLQKQNFNIVANKSLADAQTWLADEIKHWEHITKAVEIDVAQ
ncbi:MAG TPA: tripartite tricarboxylate transporter substrate-binding protein, partial [Xanthobacteraceae bacterium]|nr:tripartite tricarboxylate transporter substrate-binding protein [Xanthobacteraceae bacterium]